MELTFKNDKTCLFDYSSEINDSYAVLAGMYLHSAPHSLDQRDSKIWKKRCENGSAQEQELLEFMREYRDDHLLRLRNSQWAPEIIRLLREEPNSYFFAFGAAHFKGEHRIQKFLEAAGFKVDYVGPDDPLDPTTEQREVGDWRDWFIGLSIISSLFFAFVLILIRCSAIECRQDDTCVDDLRQIQQIWDRILYGDNRHLHAD